MHYMVALLASKLLSLLLLTDGMYLTSNSEARRSPKNANCKLDGTRSKGREERKEYLKHFNVIIFSDSGNAVWHPHGNYGLQMAGSEIEEYKSIQMSLTI